ncbi:large ribosomal subunit protein mL55-like [Halichondria panicea]|uniref:large ribosomal subunit protein mL55-like n=1 Tax=Halichondria panicea TaxID=6063 RepID=UPI00312B7DB1
MATLLHSITALQWRALPRCVPLSVISPRSHGQPLCGRSGQCTARSLSNRVTKRLEKLGIGPDGKPLPTPNVRKVFPKMYKLLMVNQDGSTYTVRHRYPHRMVTLPLDLSTLTPEQLAERERVKQAAKIRVYVEEEIEDDEWDQQHYKNLL